MECEGLRKHKEDLVVAVFAESLLIESIASPGQGRLVVVVCDDGT